MAETVEDERWAHIRGVTVTTVSSVAGLLAGVISLEVAAAPDDTMAILIMAIAVFIQFPLLRAFRIEVEDFGIKDYLYITFMTFSFWFVSFAILLTTQAELPI